MCDIWYDRYYLTLHVFLWRHNYYVPEIYRPLVRIQIMLGWQSSKRFHIQSQRYSRTLRVDFIQYHRYHTTYLHFLLVLWYLPSCPGKSKQIPLPAASTSYPQAGFIVLCPPRKDRPVQVPVWNSVRGWIFFGVFYIFARSRFASYPERQVLSRHF